MAMEESGVPSVAVHTHVFARLARASALANGMPRTRQALRPAARGRSHRPRNCAIISRVTDPVSKRPFMQEVIEGLTDPLTDEDLKGLSFDRSTPRLLAPDTEDNLHALFIENRWTDFLPPSSCRRKNVSPRC